MTLDFNISNKIKIGNFVVSNKNPCLIVAELSGNHGGKKKNGAQNLFGSKNC